MHTERGRSTVNTHTQPTRPFVAHTNAFQPTAPTHSLQRRRNSREQNTNHVLVGHALLTQLATPGNTCAGNDTKANGF